MDKIIKEVEVILLDVRRVRAPISTELMALNVLATCHMAQQTERVADMMELAHHRAVRRANR